MRERGPTCLFGVAGPSAATPRRIHWRPRWVKVYRDVLTERGRIALMLIAIAVSLMGIGAVLGAYGILTREMARNYLGTRPASASLELSAAVDHELLEAVRKRSGIVEAAAGEIVLARAKVGHDWRPLLLFVVRDFGDLRLNTFRHQSGAWPPPTGSMLIERTAKQVLEAGEGSSVWVKTPHGAPREVPIVGVVHDPGLAPAWQEAEGYGYITPATLAALGESAELRELRILVGDRPFERAAVDARVVETSRWLRERGVRVVEARVPPPGKHPHQTQMYGVLFLMLVFAGLTLVLSGVLVATSLAGMLARQVREIGIMKTLGASRAQLVALYAVLVAALGITAFLVALPSGVMGAHALARMSGRMLNLELASLAIPSWVFAVQGFSGVVVPLLAAAVPIAGGTRATIRTALDANGAVVPRAVRLARIAVLFGRIFSNRVLAMAVRNAVRRRARFVLTLLLLAMGGAMFQSALNISRGWQRIVARVYENRSYDVEVRLQEPVAPAVVEGVPGVRRVEAWGYLRTALWKPQGVDIVRTYPDGSHGSLVLMAPPLGTELVRFPLLSGRWLEPGDGDGIVLNHMVLNQTPGTRVGDSITISVRGEPTTWRVVGIVEEVGSPGAVYVNPAAFSRLSGVPESQSRMLRIATQAGSPGERTHIIRRLEDRLAEQHVPVESVIPLSVLRSAMGDHVIVLIRMLLAMAGLMVIVGGLGLATTMSTSVIERTREIAVLKTLGATPWSVARLVVTEALVVALTSWVVAGGVAVPLTVAIGRTVGQLSFRVSLPFEADPSAVFAWLVFVACLAVLATVLPAWRAARLTVREALMLV
ncbi:MAG TPA: ABC transporter permease [Polyangiaceae bacterium]|nr:ABC transporter permease [Polyangiaceae bacterium]